MSATTEQLGRVPRRVLALAREHWLLLVLLVAATALRVVTQLAYRPALLHFDSRFYLANAADLRPFPVRPLGYAAFLRLLPIEGELAYVPLVQHLLGLAMGVLVYAVLVTLGAKRWLAALATVPVLLDAYQLNIEQQILSETLFEFFVLAGCVILLLRRPPGVLAAGGAGLLFALATVTRGNALLVIVPAVLALVFLRARLTSVAALVGAFAIPLVAYVAWFHSLYGVYALTGYEGRFLYGRVAPFADCTQFSVPASQRVLCPEQPIGRRPTVEEFQWSRKSPVFRLQAPPGSEERRWLYRSETAGKFATTVIAHQPVTYARTVASDFVRSFAPTRESRPGELPVARWQFQLEYPIYREETYDIIRRHGDLRPRADRRLASFLRAYQRYAYTPGPILAACLLLGVAAAVGIGRARRSALRAAAFLVTGTALVILLPPLAINQFTWRYALPQLVFLPLAGVLGLTALTRGRRAAAPEAGRPVDERAGRAAPEPDGRRAAHERAET